MKKCTKPKAVPREADAGLHVPLYVTLTLTSGIIAAYNHSVHTAIRRWTNYAMHSRTNHRLYLGDGQSDENVRNTVRFPAPRYAQR